MSHEHQHASHQADPHATQEHSTQQGYEAAFTNETTPDDGHNRSPLKLSAFMKVSIVILVAVTLASISLLFIGDFDGKFERVFSTLALFTIFVLLTAFDTRRERAAHWYAPIALIANAYILGLLLIIIWVTPFDVFTLQMRIMWTSVYVIVVTRVVVWAVGALLRIGTRRPASVARWGQITSVFAILTLILFTAPLGIEAFGVFVPDLYWRIAVATLILTGLGLAVTLLLSWYYRPEVPASQTAPYAPVAPAPSMVQQPMGPPMASPMASPPAAPYAHVQPQPQSQHQQPTAAFPAPSQTERLPWPTFADGSPYPMAADGQPDFAAVERMQTPAQPASATTEQQLHESAQIGGDVNDSVVPAEPAVAASSVLADDPGIHAESLVAEGNDEQSTESVQEPVQEPVTPASDKPESIVQEEAILLPELSQTDAPSVTPEPGATHTDASGGGQPDPAQAGEHEERDPIDEETSKRSQP